MTMRHRQSAGSSLFAPYKVETSRLGVGGASTQLLIHCILLQRHTYASVQDQAVTNNAIGLNSFVLLVGTLKAQVQEVLPAHVVNAENCCKDTPMHHRPMQNHQGTLPGAISCVLVILSKLEQIYGQPLVCVGSNLVGDGTVTSPVQSLLCCTLRVSNSLLLISMYF